MRKKLLNIFPLLIILFLFSLMLVEIKPIQAANDSGIEFVPQIGIPGSKTFREKNPVAIGGDTKKITLYIKDIYEWAIGIVGIVAALALMIGGVIWLTAGGNQNRVGTAKSIMGGALSGLVLALGSYLLLYQIDEDLVKLEVKNIAPVEAPPEVEERGCCEWPDGSPTISTKDYCEGGETKGTYKANSYPGEDRCITYKTLRETCKEQRECEEGLICVKDSILFIDKSTGRCTDGEPGSPCFDDDHCVCVDAGQEPNCVDDKCTCEN